MKKLLAILFISLFFVPLAFSQKSTDSTRANKPARNISQFWFVLLKTGPKTDFDSTERAKLFEGHMSNMGRLHREGVLKVAGPFGKNDFTWRGIFILDCKTKEEAEQIASTDPAIAAGLFAVDIVPWYGEPSGSFKPGKPEKKE